MATTNTEPSVKQYYDYAQKQIDEQAILDKYNAATLAQFNIQREQNRLNENSFYNQMYNTQRTAMDTIRQSNAAAVSTGASRGIQAANELSALLGLQQESVASATELAQANRQTAQEETAAVLENVLNAYSQAAQERSQLVTQAIEAASVDAQEAANQIAAQQAATQAEEVDIKFKEYLMDLKLNDVDLYNREVALKNNATNLTGMSQEQLNLNASNATQALSELDYNVDNLLAKKGDYNSLLNIYTAYGFTKEDLETDLNTINSQVQDPNAAPRVARSVLSGTSLGATAGLVGGPAGVAIGALVGFVAGMVGGHVSAHSDETQQREAFEKLIQLQFATRYEQKYKQANGL